MCKKPLHGDLRSKFASSVARGRGRVHCGGLFGARRIEFKGNTDIALIMPRLDDESSGVVACIMGPFLIMMGQPALGMQPI